MPHRHCAALRFLILLAGLILSVPLFAASIDPVNKYAWAENAGWQNFNSTNNSASVQVYTDHLEGYLWAENVGWIRLGSFSGGGTHPYANTNNTDYGINRTGSTLTGYAWSENAGWVNFAPTTSGVTLNATTGQFDGYAWSENLGWIHLKGTATDAATYGVAMLTGGATTLTSSINPSTVGQTVTFTATVAGTPTPTGTVSFTADGTAITGCTAKTLTSGATTCATASLSVGSRTIAATTATGRRCLWQQQRRHLHQRARHQPVQRRNCQQRDG
ncbi:MAG: Ig-like domain-containing protein [Candidatus Contendobacter sp.]|nr:Ig-like domain-containing protein [Candidatus Contendobacter sp.]